MIMKKNVGYWDSIIRTIAGAIIVSLGLFYDNYWGFVGLYLVFSGVVEFSPIYRIIGFTTMDPNLEREN